MEILKLREHSELASEAAEWFHSKWDIPVEVELSRKPHTQKAHQAT